MYPRMLASHHSDLAKGTTLIICNEELSDIKKISQSLEVSGLLIKGIRKQLKMEQKNRKEDFFECY